jgi:phosphoglycerate dehydrogenase-like enzyme
VAAAPSAAPFRVAVSPTFAGVDVPGQCTDLDGIAFVAADDPATFPARAAACDMLIVNSPNYSAALAAGIGAPGSRIRFIQFVSAGFETAEYHGVPKGAAIANGSLVWAPVVAEHAVAVLLALWRDVVGYERLRLERRWERGDLLRRLRSADGAHVGILGYGQIGTEMARRLKGFGTRVTGIARRPKPCAAADAVIGLDDLPGLLGSLDALVVAIPAGPRTHRIVDAAMLAALKPGAVLISIGRGSTIDEDALVAALSSGHVAGAGLDVFAAEPLPAEHAFWGLENVILSPHVAGFGSPAALDRLHGLCRENIVNAREGRALVSAVSLG